MNRLAVVVAVALLACARVGEDAIAPTDSGGPTTDAIAPGDASCVGATTGSYACGADVRACDPQRPTGLPSGACAPGATCNVTVRPASCNCDVDDGPRSPWSCTCVDGDWQCKAEPQDARVCGCLLDPPFTASCEAAPPVPRTGRFVQLGPKTGSTSAYPGYVSLSVPSAASKDLLAAVVSTIRLFSFRQRAWVRTDITASNVDPGIYSWSVAPRDQPYGGEWALRVGPFAPELGIEYLDSGMLFCDGRAETLFTVIAE